MRTFSETFAAGEAKKLNLVGSYFRLLTTSGAVDVKFLRQNMSVGDSASQVEAGYYAIPEGGFDAVELTSATAQTVKFAVTRGRGGYDRVIGDVTTILATTVTNTAGVSVGAAATALVAAATARRGLRFYNAGTADVWLGGAGVTTANGCIKIGPGQTWIEDDAPGAAWYGVSGTAGQNVRIQELT